MQFFTKLQTIKDFFFNNEQNQLAASTTFVLNTKNASINKMTKNTW